MGKILPEFAAISGPGSARVFEEPHIRPKPPPVYQKAGSRVTSGVPIGGDPAGLLPWSADRSTAASAPERRRQLRAPPIKFSSSYGQFAPRGGARGRETAPSFECNNLRTLGDRKSARGRETAPSFECNNLRTLGDRKTHKGLGFAGSGPGSKPQISCRVAR